MPEDSEVAQSVCHDVRLFAVDMLPVFEMRP
jgi:hypothetical protein